MGWYVHSLQMQIGADSLTLTLNLLNQKINRLRRIVDDYYCVRFQIIPINGTHPDTHPHTHIIRHDVVVTVSAPPYYVVGADNELKAALVCALRVSIAQTLTKFKNTR